MPIYEDPNTEKLSKIFFPYMHGQMELLKRESTQNSEPIRFAYYSSAETIVKILTSREIWMRNALVMNDRSEIKHGLDCLDIALSSASGEHFKEAINVSFSGLFEEVIKLFKNWNVGVSEHTYITSFSRHFNQDDKYGRLSMWRAYGGENAAAIVFNAEALLRPAGVFGVYSSPVAYWEKESIDLEEQLLSIANNMNAHRSFLQSINRSEIRDRLFNVLLFAAVSLKHPAFLEEREWRIIHSPAMLPSEYVSYERVTIGGVPQCVVKVPLKDRMDIGLYGIEPNDSVYRVLIGPCQYPEVIYQSIRDALYKAGVENPQERIVKTDIPIRPLQR